jgi:hypothetical protein
MGQERRCDSAETDLLELDQVILSYLLATTTGLKTGSGYPAFVIGGTRGGDGVTKYICECKPTTPVLRQPSLCAISWPRSGLRGKSGGNGAESDERV